MAHKCAKWKEKRCKAFYSERKKALADLDSLFITKKQIRNLLTLIKLERKTNEVYSQLKSNYLARLKTLGLINSGIEGVPIRLIEAKRRKRNAKQKLED